MVSKDTVIPRTFKLLAEFEKGGDAFYTYGLEDRKTLIINKILSI